MKPVPRWVKIVWAVIAAAAIALTVAAWMDGQGWWSAVK